MQSASILLQPGVMPRLLQGLWVTIWLAAVSVALSVPVGLVTGWLMTLRNPVIRVIMRIYLDFIRIMPQLALLFIAFYGLARAWNWNLDATGACVLCSCCGEAPNSATSCVARSNRFRRSNTNPRTCWA